MGYYLETPGHLKGKAVRLLETLPRGEDVIPEEDDWQGFRDRGLALVCVMDNGAFEAAGFAFSAKEFQVFFDTYGDYRRRQWIALDWDAVCAATGYRE